MCQIFQITYILTFALTFSQAITHKLPHSYMCTLKNMNVNLATFQLMFSGIDQCGPTARLQATNTNAILTGTDYGNPMKA